MLGRRAAYQTPGLSAEADRLVYGGRQAAVDPRRACSKPCAPTLSAISLQAGGSAMSPATWSGLFHGLPGARRYRQILSVEGVKPGAGPEVLARGLRGGG